MLTAQSDTIYWWMNLDLSEGPLVVETPPMALGMIDDAWFGWVTDIGLPGPDRGLGGKYLLLPPGYTGELPESGYIVNTPRTIRLTMNGRAFQDNNDPTGPVASIKKTLKVYPYKPGGYGSTIGAALDGKGSLARTPDHKLDVSYLKPQPPVKFVEATGKVMSTIPPSDYTYFELINEVVQREPAGALDPEIMGHLAAVGIVKGKPFTPDARMKKILTDAAAIGSTAGRIVSWSPRESEGFAYYPGSQWLNWLFVGGYTFETPPAEVSSDGTITVHPSDGARKIHSRLGMYYYATAVTPAMVMKLTGIGSQYLMAMRDSNGEYLDGAKTYKLTLPKDIPAERFWSITVYDNQTRSMLDTPQRFPRAGSQSFPTPAAVPNPDGSTTVYFGPTKPEGIGASNWIQTLPGKGFNTILRCYSPTETFFTKTWRPSEVELVK
jgi:hypothetical protein